MSYLARLKAILRENRPSQQLTELTQVASVSFVSDRGSPISGREGPSVSSVSGGGSPFSPDLDALDLADVIEERAALAAGRVPAAFLDAWARLNCQRPFDLSDTDWRRVLDDGGRFLDQWGHDAAALGWRPGDVFDVRGGLVSRLAGRSVEAIGPDHARLSDGERVALRTKPDEVRP